jgi:hypothetical protein
MVGSMRLALVEERRKGEGVLARRRQHKVLAAVDAISAGRCGVDVT